MRHVPPPHHHTVVEFWYNNSNTIEEELKRSRRTEQKLSRRLRCRLSAPSLRPSSHSHRPSDTSLCPQPPTPTSRVKRGHLGGGAISWSLSKAKTLLHQHIQVCSCAAFKVSPGVFDRQTDVHTHTHTLTEQSCSQMCRLCTAQKWVTPLVLCHGVFLDLERSVFPSSGR